MGNKIPMINGVCEGQAGWGRQTYFRNSKNSKFLGLMGPCSASGWTWVLTGPRQTYCVEFFCGAGWDISNTLDYIRFGVTIS